MRMQKTGFWLALLLVITILTLGAREAWASAHSTTCMDDGWTFLGWKPSADACLTACSILHPDLVDIHYGAQGCCSCLF